MISALNITGSRIPYQMQTLTASEPASSSQANDGPSGTERSSDSVSLSTQARKLDQEKGVLKKQTEQKHIDEIRELDQEYSRKQMKIEQEYSQKINELKVNLYA
ncbi:hypothetical protein MTBBW1_1030017 [Desulfamplus magnetovallimortis]|uniref:Uncharacterized protein n=1 Tax=Desulfamplus magnetovallimortis TaxID=1246637 RepID=A0A1W1H587_9BACT|nr:hypothetical protein [Desulfamplus magnetovallimortis]SLM27528.1 hypothetical protein MTBBW1_1030017 [Desulfamplus magnetovallimortis]